MVIEMADGKIINMHKNNFCKKCLTDLLVGQTVIISGVEKNGEFKPFKGKSDSSQCGGCQQQNEIKSNNTCNNIQKGRKNNKKDK